MDLNALSAAIKQGMEAAKTRPGRYGGRYVASKWDEKTKTELWVVLKDDDPEIEYGVDIVAQCLPDRVFGIGGARHWFNEDGTINQEYWERQ